MPKKLLSIILIITVLCSYITVSYAGDEVVAPLAGYEASGLYTEQQYNFIKAKVAAKEEPWYSAYVQMLSLADEWLYEEPSAVEHWYVPGYYGDAEGHKNARQTLMNDAKSAYACAVAYKFTGLKKYAEQTIKILDDWTKLTSLGYEDSGLVFSYVGDSLIMSADLVKGYPYWTNKAAFDTWVKDHYIYLANKSWSSGNSGDWNLLARSVGYAYLGDMESLKSIIVGEEEQSGSVKYLIARIREDGILHKELERGSNGLWYSYFALAPLTACCQVLYNNLGEDYFNWQSSEGRSVKKAVETYFYYCNHLDEWNQAYKDYYDGTKTTSVWYPDPVSSTSWPLPLFESMAGVYNNQQFCDYVGRYRPVHGTIDGNVYHHFAWFFPTLMYGSLQLGNGVPQYTAPDITQDYVSSSEFSKIAYYQPFEDDYTLVNSTTPNGRDKYSVMDGDKEIYYIEKAADAYGDCPISIVEDGVYDGKGPSAALSNSAKVVVNLPRSYTAEDGRVSLVMRVYRPNDNTAIHFYEKPVDEAYNIPSDNLHIAYISHVKYQRFFFNATKSDMAKLPSGNDYYNYSNGSWTWFKLDFDFGEGNVAAFYKDARNDKIWLPWGVDNNIYTLWGQSVGSIVFDGKGSARVDDVTVTTENIYPVIDGDAVKAVITDAKVNTSYQWQVSGTADFASYSVASSGTYSGEELSVVPQNGNYVRLVLDGKSTAAVRVPDSLYSTIPRLYRYGGSSATDWGVDALSQIRTDMYGAATVYNTGAEDREVLLVAAMYDDGNLLRDLKTKTATIPAGGYCTVATDVFAKTDVDNLRIMVIDPDTLTECSYKTFIPKW